MDEPAIRRWHQRREALFPVKLPYSALTVINTQLPKLEEDTAMTALQLYSEAKPYRGFYMLKYMTHYERALTAERDPPFSRTDSAPKGAAAAATNDGGDDIDAERREREAYEALPGDYREACKSRYAEWGWPVASRAFRLICLDAYVGRDVTRYRIGTNVFTRDQERERDLKSRQEFMERTGYVQLITQLRHEVHRLGGNIDVIA
jgi:hypothetical protein